MKNRVSLMASMLLLPVFAYSQIGIHTSNPQGSFHVDGAKDNPASGTPSGTQQLNDMVLKANGNFGLGTTVPENKFQVVATNSVNNRYTLIDAANSNGKYPILALRNTSPIAAGNFSLLGFTNNGTNGFGATWGIGSIRNQTNSNEDFYFGNSQINNEYVERMRIASNGYIGVNTSTPENRFHIVTTESVNNRYTLIDAANSNGKYPILALRNTSPVAAGNFSLLGFTNNGTNGFGATWGIGSIRNQTNSNEDFYFGNSQINNEYVERMRIASNGYIGVNTSTPENRFHIVTTESVNNRYTLIDAANSNGKYPILALRNTSPVAAGNFSLLGFTNNGTNGLGASWGIGSIRNQANTNEDFYFGNSPINNEYVERMRIKDNGYVGINTSTPENRFHVVATEYVNNRYTLIDASNGGIDYPIFSVRNTATAAAGNFALIGFANNGPNALGANWGIGSLRNGTNTNEDFFFGVSQGGHYLERMRITNKGSLGIGTDSPTSLLSVNGTADKPGGGSWGTFSDRRVKKDIADFKDGLNVINQLKPVTYKYNEKSGYEDLNKQYVGFIAQDVEKVAPYMINVIDDSAKSGLKDKRELDESALTKILVNAIQEQQKEIEELKKAVSKLKKE
ncbi:tail fiber domain-containing protein [Chryseobacterium sp. MIQD13]|uniref:tail fiber domain-containing protein n=1 Tax=Chryseobacterium sp. MIQD13 TaxID=3422310 RepID=UPI003D28A48E